MSNNWFDEAMTLEKSDNINNRKFKGKNYYENSLPSRRNIFKQRGRNIKELDNGYDEDDEDDDDADDFVGRGRVKIPRVQTSDGPEGCSCYPKRSDKNLPSMLYEGLQCKHTGLKGETHAGVAKFSGNWKEEYEEADPESTMPQKTSYILGYPKPINLDPGNSEGDENYANSYENQFEVDKGGFKHTSKRKPASQSSRKNVSRKSKKDHGKPDDVTQKTKEPKPFAGLLDDMEEDDEEPERPVAKPILEGITLPQIGFTPPSTPSRDKLRSHDRQSARSATRSLPPLPESPFLSNRDENSKTRRHSIIQEDDYSTDDDDIGGDGYRRKQKHSNIAEREFIGHYYDAGKLICLVFSVLYLLSRANPWKTITGTRNGQLFKKPIYK